MLEHQLELQDWMFQEYREGKEREITELTRIKQDLEIRLQAALGSEDGTFDLLHPSAKGLLCLHDCVCYKYVYICIL